MLEQLKTDWRATIEGRGGHCPCCGKWGRINPATMNETRAMALLWLSRAHCDANGWVDVPKAAPRWLMRGKTHTTLQHWALVESGASNDTAKSGSGLWRVTAKGLHFLCGTINVPRKAFIYNNLVEGWSQEQTSFKDCFGRKFDYAEVMADNFNLNALKIT